MLESVDYGYGFLPLYRAHIARQCICSIVLVVWMRFCFSLLEGCGFFSFCVLSVANVFFLLMGVLVLSLLRCLLVSVAFLELSLFVTEPFGGFVLSDFISQIVC